MTHRTNTPACSSPRLFAAVRPLLSGARAPSIRWALGCGALLGVFGCQSAPEPKLQGEPVRTASGVQAPAAAKQDTAPKADTASTPEGVAQPSSAAAPNAPTAPAKPSAQVGLAKYEEPAAAPSPLADAPKAAPGQPVQGTVVQDDSFSIWLQAVSPVAAGSPATVEAVLVAKAPYHCNAEYPHKFKLATAPAGLSYPEATVKGMQVTAERSVLRIPVLAQSAGKPTVSGTLQFSVCNDERCLVEKRELSLNLEVK